MANPIVSILMDDGKTIRLELYPDKAPITVENFLKLVKSGFYDGLCFHRIIPGFMIQSIKGEFRSNGVPNDLKHVRGVISMARAMDPNSAGSQFFIMHADAPHLDGEYAAFGSVIEGMDEVDRIANTPTGFQDAPMEDVIMKKLSLEETEKA